MDLLVKIVTEEYQEDKKWRNSIPTLKIHVDRKKALKGGEANDEVLNEDDFPKRRASKKSISFMDSASTASSAKKKHAVTIENRISKAESSLKECDKILKIKRRSRSKRIRVDVIDDEEEKVGVGDADQEWVPNMPLKKKKKNSSKKGGGSTRHNPTAEKPLPSMVSIPIPTPDLSQEFKNKIGKMGGNEITLIIQKCLYNSDLNKQQARLSMPLNKVKNKDFLRPGEVQVLANKQVVRVPLIQPSFELTNVALAKWDMPKSSGVITSSYVLRSSWMKVARANQLEQDDVVQVWSFRVQDQLCMVLVKV